MPDTAAGRRAEWDRSAGDYATFALQSVIYTDTAAALVREARIKRGMTVIDLACGTGIVTETILRERSARNVSIVATDFSPDMISVARTRISSPQVSFRCEAAEHLSRVSPRPVDRVLCNAAFWQFDRDRVLAELVQVLKPRGRCLFTLPDWQAWLGEPDALYDQHKLLWMVFEEIGLRGRRLPVLPRRSASAAAANDSAEARRYSRDGLRVTGVERVAVAATARDYLSFLQIPVMFTRFAQSSGVPEEEMREILTVVANQLAWIDCEMPPPQIWKVVVLERV